ncbi:Uncharacterized protein Fot_40496 [Forsythia ovata]|uniref:Transposase n=1 Tax=Forsythia ovata TaxID=205694 RepID=A0ABD1S958_9LAMI
MAGNCSRMHIIKFIELLAAGLDVKLITNDLTKNWRKKYDARGNAVSHCEVVAHIRDKCSKEHFALSISPRGRSHQWRCRKGGEGWRNSFGCYKLSPVLLMQ